jgi:hypothetical protein
MHANHDYTSYRYTATTFDRNNIVALQTPDRQLPLGDCMFCCELTWFITKQHLPLSTYWQVLACLRTLFLGQLKQFTLEEIKKRSLMGVSELEDVHDPFFQPGRPVDCMHLKISNTVCLTTLS